jgi:hypothetical protein
VRTYIDSDSNELRRIFWMSPHQRRIYRRYHDVIVQDNTAKTNKLFHLAVFVAVDTNGKSRIVATALVLRETSLDYEWLLMQLLDASKGDDGRELAPKVVLVDEDLGMDLALRHKLPDTHIVNCIWHLAAINLPTNLIRRLGGAAFKTFMVKFWLAQKSLTSGEFEARWEVLREEALAKNKRAARYLRRVFKHRHQWARFQVARLFTAGMQSTQRVESAHSLIKRKGSDKHTPLKDLFTVIESRLKDEDLTERHILLEDNTKVDSRELHVKTYFPGVVDVNNKYLGRFAKEGMLDEMRMISRYTVCAKTGRMFLILFILFKYLNDNSLHRDES